MGLGCPGEGELMPWPRKTLTQLRADAASDVASNLPGSDPLLRFASLKITGDVLAGHAHDHNGYLDYIAKQSNPYTATGEFLEAWAALKNVFREPATVSVGAVTFSGTDTNVVPAGTPLARGDGVAFVSTADATVSGSVVVVPATAVVPGASGNTDLGAQMQLGQAISGVQSTGSVTTEFVDGADVETDDNLRTRMLQRYQQPPQGGGGGDYVGWAKEVAGVTRAWEAASGMGTGTVVVYVMLDNAESAHGGFPQGSDGVASSEKRGAVASGDQLTVANYIYGPGRQPVTALVYVASPLAHVVDFTLTGTAAWTGDMETAAEAAIDDTFSRFADLAGTVDVNQIWTAISAVNGTDGFIITVPAANISLTTGQLPVRGTVTFGA